MYDPAAYASSAEVTVLVKEILSTDGKKKVVVFRRDSGTFGFEVLRWSEDPLEMCWIPSGRYSVSITEDAAAAEREARSRVEWLRAESEGDVAGR